MANDPLIRRQRNRSTAHGGGIVPSEGLGSAEVYSAMALSRELDTQLAPIHGKWFPATGEEATIVGAFCDLRNGDVAAPHYRGAPAVHYLRGADLNRLVAQAWGKTAGYNKGRSVPFTGPTNLGCIPWVAGDLGSTIGVATGAALALSLRQSTGVVVCSFGDGTSNRGDFHESLNLAACLRLPIVYVCQNNGWSISQPAETYVPAPISARAAGYGIPGLQVDGNDVAAVRRVVGEAVDRARRGQGPSLIEARTWRASGHWAADNLSYRDAPGGETPPDPIQRYRTHLIETGEATEEGLAILYASASSRVTKAIEMAKSLPDPGVEDIGLDEVFATRW